MVLLHLLGRQVEFIGKFRPPLPMQSTSTVLVTGIARFNLGSCICEGDKDIFGTMTSIWNHDQHLEVVLLFPPKSRGIEGHPGCSWFSRAKDHEA